jgi:hypothetical protein
VIGNLIEALVEHEPLLFVTGGHGRLVGFQLLDDLTAVDFGPLTTSQPLLELGHFRFSCSQSRLGLTQPLLQDKRKNTNKNKKRLQSKGKNWKKEKNKTDKKKSSCSDAIQTISLLLLLLVLIKYIKERKKRVFICPVMAGHTMMGSLMKLFSLLFLFLYFLQAIVIITHKLRLPPFFS